MNTRNLSNNLLAGLLMGIMNLSVAFSVASLLFNQTTPEYLEQGVFILLLGTFIIGLGGTLFSGFGGVICAPRSAMAPVLAIVIANIHMSLQDTAQALPTILMVLMLNSLLLGITLILLSKLRLEILLRALPYPVMGGFFAGIGLLFINSGLTIATNRPLGLETLGDPALVKIILATVGLAVILHVVMRKFRHWIWFPLALCLALLGFYVFLWFSGLTVTDAVDLAWLPTVSKSTDTNLLTLASIDLGQVHWDVIFSHANYLYTAVFLNALLLLLDLSGIEMLIGRDLSARKELQVMGGSNIVSGALGGFSGVHVVADTAFTWKLGGNRRLTGFAYAAVTLAVLLFGQGLIGLTPAFILGALLFYVGMDLLLTWVWRLRTSLPKADYAIVLVVAGVVVIDILAGVALGLLISITLFVINYSKLNVVRNELIGTHYSSHFDYKPQQREFLNEQMRHVLIMTFQGFIFFGTAEKLLAAVKRRLRESPEQEIQFLILDFHHVSQLDISAMQVFQKITKTAQSHEIHILVTGIDQNAYEHLQNTGFPSKGDLHHRLVFLSLNDGIRWCEEYILHQASQEWTMLPTDDTINESTVLEDTAFTQVDLRDPIQKTDKRLQRLLSSMFGEQTIVEQMSDFLIKRKYAPQEYLFHYGDQQESCYLIAKGKISTFLPQKEREQILHQHEKRSIIGEMALFGEAIRTASARAEDDVIVYRLDKSALRQLSRLHPHAANAFHEYVLNLTCQRLRRSNHELLRHL